MFIVKNRKIFYSISVVLLFISIYSLFVYKLKPNVEFTGGSLLAVDFEGEIPGIDVLKNNVSKSGFEESSIRKAGDNGYIIRLKEIKEEEKNNILNNISEGGKYKPVVKEFNNVGPVLGKEAITKSWVSVFLVLLAIVLFITFSFRKVSKPIPSWVYGAVAIIALLHDVLIPMGLFSILGHFKGVEVGTLFVTALLVILGFSIHDTIVVFDRVRENLKKREDHNQKTSFEDIVSKSVEETFVRSLNTSFTTLLAIVALYIFGPESTRYFSLAMGVGILAGTYSSIFIGSPLLVTIEKWRAK